MSGYGVGTYGDETYGSPYDVPPLPDGWPEEPPHGIGPPRPGLHPRVGRFPGHDPTRDTSPPRRTIQYPGTGVDRRPGRSLYIFDSTGGREFSLVSTLGGLGRILVDVGTRGLHRVSTLAGSGFLSDTPLSSSDLPTTLSQVVTLGTVSERVELASSGGTVELGSGSRVVELQ